MKKEGKGKYAIEKAESADGKGEKTKSRKTLAHTGNTKKAPAQKPNEPKVKAGQGKKAGSAASSVEAPSKRPRRTSRSS